MSLRKKLLSFLLGLFFAVVVLELSLRIIGFIQNQEQAKAFSKSSGQFNIVNLGNSYTAGSGAPPEKSYSRQLNELLDKKKNNYYRVINRGRGSVNTSYILENLPSWLKEDKPKIVFIMAGEPNYWNKYNYWNFLKKRNSTYASKEYSLDFLRVFKLFNLYELLVNRAESWNLSPTSNFSSTFKGISIDEKSRGVLGYLWLGSLLQGESYNVNSLNSQQYNEALIALDYIYKKYKNPAAALLMAEIYLVQVKDPMKALYYLDNSISMVDYFHYGQYFLLQKFDTKEVKISKIVGSLLQKIMSKKRETSVKEIERWYTTRTMPVFVNRRDEIKYAVSMFKYYPESNKILTSTMPKMMYSDPLISLILISRTLEMNPLSPSNNLLEFAEQIVTKFPNFKNFFDKELQIINARLSGIDYKTLIFKDEMEKEWIKSDIEEMIKLIQKSGAVAVVQTYPPFRDGSTRPADLVIREWWKNEKESKNLKFMDVGELLSRKFSKLEGGNQYYSDEFGPTDNHQNAQGYLEISKLMLPVVLDIEESLKKEDH